jgi:hypothetical protein
VGVAASGGGAAPHDADETGPPLCGRPAAGQHVPISSALDVERCTIAQIAEDQRHGRPRDLFTIWFTSNLIPPAIVTGALATGDVRAAVRARADRDRAGQPGGRAVHGAALGTRRRASGCRR